MFRGRDGYTGPVGFTVGVASCVQHYETTPCAVHELDLALRSRLSAGDEVIFILPPRQFYMECTENREWNTEGV